MDVCNQPSCSHTCIYRTLILSVLFVVLTLLSHLVGGAWLHVLWGLPPTQFACINANGYVCAHTLLLQRDNRTQSGFVCTKLCQKQNLIQHLRNVLFFSLWSSVSSSTSSARLRFLFFFSVFFLLVYLSQLIL